MGVTIVGSRPALRAVLSLAVAVAVALLSVPASSAATAQAKGLDVSHWNGPINWIRVASSGYSFVFAKATEGFTLTDPTYSVNRSGTEGLGLRFGAYHFARPSGSGDVGITASAIAQADHFVDVAEPQPGELPPVLDLEVRGGLSPAKLTQWTQDWLDEVFRRTGVQSLIYASPNFWKSALADTTDFATAGNRLWIAHWTKKTSPVVPASDWGGQGWTFWQWTDCSTVPGFLHCSDGDRMNGPNPSAVAIGPYPAGPPVSTSPPTIVGTPKTGRALAGVPGDWIGGKPVTFSYQWERCNAAGDSCIPILGATSEAYTPTPVDAGSALALLVTAQSPGGTASAISAPTTALGGAVPTPSAQPQVLTVPQVSGTPQVGQMLTVDVGTWSGSPTSFTFQWQRCDISGATCTTISGATAQTYVPTPDDIGSALSVVVTATGAGGSTPVTTPVSAPVAAAPVPAAAPGQTTAQPDQAGAVQSPDGRATVTWQPGAVPSGATVSLGPFAAPLTVDGTQVAFSVSALSGDLPAPVDIAYAAALPGGTVLGYSTDGQTYQPVPSLPDASLPADATVGSYVANGVLHVLTRIQLRLAAFPSGRWGDPSRTPAGPLQLTQTSSTVHVLPRSDGSLLVLTRLQVNSQAHLYASVLAPGGSRIPILKKGSQLGLFLKGRASKTAQSLILKPGGIPVRVRLNRKVLQSGETYLVRVVALGPYGRRATYVFRFVAP